jgi:hypothetical protein
VPRIDIDFLGGPKAPSARVVVVALLLLVATGFIAWLCAGRWQTVADAQARLQRLVRLADDAQRPLAAPTPSLPPEQAKAINAAIDELNVPWPDILQALEETRPKEVALLQVEPNTSRARLRIVAEAKSSAVLEDYVTALLQHPPFRRFLPSHLEEVVAEGQSRVRLSFDLSWQP